MKMECFQACALFKEVLILKRETLNFNCSPQEKAFPLIQREKLSKQKLLILALLEPQCIS